MMRSGLRRARDVLMRSHSFQLAVQAAASRGCVPASFWRRLHPTGLWKLRTADGSPFFYHCASDDLLARSIVWTNLRDWEETTHPYFCQLARKARGFLDAGAYAGLYTLLACGANPDLHAVSVEPNPQSLSKLMRNVEVNNLERRVRVVGKALGSSPGRAQLAVPAWTSAASLVLPVAAERTVDVEVTTGDDVAGDIPIDLVKIDVEGLETEVLRGMADLIAAHHPKIIVECLDRLSLEQFRATALAMGYKHAYHFGVTGLTQVGHGFTPPPRYKNFLLLPGPLQVG